MIKKINNIFLAICLVLEMEFADGGNLAELLSKRTER